LARLRPSFAACFLHCIAESSTGRQVTGTVGAFSTMHPVDSWRPVRFITTSTPFMANFLVTGNAGFIGNHLVESLLAAGNTVVCIDDLSAGLLDNLAAFAKHPALRIIEGRCVTLSDRAGVESTWAVWSATVS
jgi:hypothetical protein